MDKQDEVEIITSELLDRTSLVRFGMSTRRGGISPEPLGMNLSYRVGDQVENVAENRKRFFSFFGYDPSSAAMPHQCHSSTVRCVALPGEYDSCDGLVTTTVGLPLVVTVADCLSVVLVDAERAVLGVVHAGWRGTAERIVEKAVDVMVRECAAEPLDMIAYLGPSAGVCCYEVGGEVSDAFFPEQIEKRNGSHYLDLKKANVDQLLGSGISTENIEVSDYCTICNPQLFHSYRRDRNGSGRMMALAVLSKTSEKR